MYTKEKKEQIRIAVVQSEGIAGVCRCLGMKPMGGNYRTIRKYIREMGLDISHFTGQGHARGKKGRAPNKIPLSEILTLGTSYSGSRLSKRLISEGIMERRCGGCDRTKWEGVPIPVELDHINGDSSDNRVENLRLLCPNCHAFTDTYRGRNIKVEKKEYVCLDCGCRISSESKSGLCVSCVKKAPHALSRFKVDKAGRKVAVKAVRQGQAVSDVARGVGVSRTTIKRWMGA